MNPENSSVKKETAAKPDDSMEAGDIFKALAGQDGDNSGSGVKQEGGESPDSHAESAEHSEEKMESEDAKGETEDTKPESAEGESAENETNENETAEPENGEGGKVKGQKANERIRELADQKNKAKAEADEWKRKYEQTVQEKADRLAARVAQPESGAAGKQTDDQKEQNTSAYWQRQYATLAQRRQAGEDIPDSAFEDVKAKYHEARFDERIEEKLAARDGMRRQAESQKRIVREFVELESIDPRFTVLDDNGQLVKSPFTELLFAEHQRSGLPATDDSLLITANKLAARISKGHIELAEAKARQAKTEVKQVFKKTGLSVPKPTPKPSASNTPKSRYDALMKRADEGDEDALREAAKMELAGLV